MKFINSILFVSALIFAHFICTFASPIKNKKTPPAFDNSKSEIYFKKPESWGDSIYAYVYSNKKQPEWPGYAMEKIDDYYSLTLKHRFFNNYKVIFTDGINQSPLSLEPGFDLVLEGVYDQTGVLGISYEKPYFWNEFNRKDKSLKYGNIAKVHFRPKHGKQWGEDVNFLTLKMYCHYKLGNGKWKDVKMEYDPYSMYYSLNIELNNAEKITIVFTDNNGHWDNNNGANYTFKKFENIIIDNYK